MGRAACKVGYTCAGEGAGRGSVRPEEGAISRKRCCGAVVCLEARCMGRRGREVCPQVGHSSEGFNCHCEEPGLSQGAGVLEAQEQEAEACGMGGRVQDGCVQECAEVGCLVGTWAFVLVRAWTGPSKGVRG